MGKNVVEMQLRALRDRVDALEQAVTDILNRHALPANSATQARPRKERLGKKEAAAIAARGAGDDTDWGDDLKVPSTH